MNAVGRATAFVYHVETGLFTVRNLFNERLRTDTIEEGTVVFVEARNVKRQGYYFENCIMVYRTNDAVYIGVTYFIDFQNEVVCLWRLRYGYKIDCECHNQSSMCKRRSCGFLERYSPVEVPFKEAEFFFLNQVNSSSKIRYKPREDIIDKRAGEFQCSPSNCDFYFENNNMIPIIHGVNRCRRSKGYVLVPPSLCLGCI